MQTVMLLSVISLVIINVIAYPINSKNDNQKVIGGFKAYDGQFPYQVSLRWNINGGHFCDGSIISQDWVLTSGRCISGELASSINVVVGSIYLNVGGATHSISVLIPHHDYNPSNHLNDIGLIRVTYPIVKSNNVRPVGLNNEPSSVGLPLTVSGWGLTKYPSNVFPNILQWLIMLSISNYECQQKNLEKEIFDTHICTLPRVGQGICHGDSGSPLVYRNQQHGISSWPVPCGEGLPDIYTRVSTYRYWIETITNI